jgi:hypothetical protein
MRAMRGGEIARRRVLARAALNNRTVELCAKSLLFLRLYQSPIRPYIERRRGAHRAQAGETFMPHNSVAYVWNMGGPGELENHLADIQASGLTTVILFGIHLGRPILKFPDLMMGDLLYNDYAADPPKILRGNLLVSRGKFNPNNDPVIAAWPAQVAQLKKHGSVSKVFISIGGASQWVYDFRVIESMYLLDAADVLEANFQALKDAFTFDGACAIDGFDIDNEEGVSADTIVNFCTMLFEQKFEVTFCPYSGPSVWQDYMQKLLKAGHEVSWWNLQCYAGGSWNLHKDQFQLWIDALDAVGGKKRASAASYLVPGLGVKGVEDLDDREQRCPFGSKSFEEIAAGWKNLGLAGVFMWKYDGIAKNPDLCGKGQNNLANYVNAINSGLSKK